MAPCSGLAQKEIDQKFDRIVDFAELWDFIFDTADPRFQPGCGPGLVLRLQPILDRTFVIVDEVMAVGDRTFLHKSYNRIMEFRDNGATILIVSHSIKLHSATLSPGSLDRPWEFTLPG